jgi:hypothetical protein
MTEKDCARLQAHHSNIGRYRRLLETDLSETERTFIQIRLSEEVLELSSLAAPRVSTATINGPSVNEG